MVVEKRIYDENTCLEEQSRSAFFSDYVERLSGFCAKVDIERSDSWICMNPMGMILNFIVHGHDLGFVDNIPFTTPSNIAKQ